MIRLVNAHDMPTLEQRNEGMISDSCRCHSLSLINYISFVNTYQPDFWQCLSPFTKWKHSQALSPPSLLWYEECFVLPRHVISLNSRNTISAKSPL